MALVFEQVQLRKGDFELFADFEISAGSRIAVIGPSGAGKSTLFDALAGFLEPVSGVVSWDGQLLNNLKPGERPVAMLFQDNNLFPHLNVAQNIGLALSHKRKLTPEQTAEVKSVLSRVGLSGMSNRRLSELSGGQLSRVALARLLFQDRPVWLLDEPFAALGPGLKSEMIDLVEEFAADANATVLMITHDLGVVARYADRVAVMYGGRVVETASAANLYHRPSHPYTQGLMNSIPTLDGVAGSRLNAIVGQPPDLANPPPGCAFHPRCPHAHAACQQAKPELAEVEPGHYRACFGHE